VGSATATLARGCSARGIVTAVEPGHIEVEFDAAPRCHGCDGACAWYRISDRRRALLSTPLELRVGAAVTVGLASRHWVLAALIVYGLPLAAVVGGALLGWTLGGTDLGTAAGAAGALAGVALVAGGFRARWERLTLRSLVVEPVD
jgi:positive regulator of sigma E activity